MLASKETATAVDDEAGGAGDGAGGAADEAGPEREVAQATISAAIENTIGCRACIAGPQQETDPF
jgi:hypothetical protein